MLFLSKIGKFAFYFPKISCIYHVYFKLHTGLTKNWVKIGKNVKFSSKNGEFLIQIQRFCTYIFLFTVQRLYSYHIYFFELWNYIYIYSYLKSLCTVYVLYRTSLWLLLYLSGCVFIVAKVNSYDKAVVRTFAVCVNSQNKQKIRKKWLDNFLHVQPFDTFFQPCAYFTWNC